MVTWTDMFSFDEVLPVCDAVIVQAEQAVLFVVPHRTVLQETHLNTSCKALKHAHIHVIIAKTDT